MEKDTGRRGGRERKRKRGEKREGRGTNGQRDRGRGTANLSVKADRIQEKRLRGRNE